LKFEYFLQMKNLYFLVLIAFLLVQCASTEEVKQNETAEDFANVLEVKANKNGDDFSFNVTIKSPDTGCDQYADWWEVISEDEQLIYRRILLHSHVDEQPFTRSGGPIEIENNQNVWIRAHMNNNGFGGKTFHGSVENGFEVKDMPSDFALDLENEEPLPDECAF